MDFILVGAPGTGKKNLIDGLTKRFSLSVNDGLSVKGYDYALGRLADYRVELKMAVDRSFAMAETTTAHRIFSHTLIDSVAYSSTRYVVLRETQASSQYTEDTWAIVTAAIGAMLRDTLKFDNIFFLPSTDGEYQDIDEALQAVLDGFGTAYTLLEGDEEQNVRDAGDVIDSYIRGTDADRETGQATEESNGTQD